MNRRKLILLVIILLLGAGLRVGFFYLNPNNIDPSGADESWSKINIAIRWLYSGDTIPDLAFGPLHSYMIATLYLINKEQVVLLSRLANLVLGILSLLLFFCLLKEVLDEKTALAGTFLLAIYPLHIHLSSVSLAEVPAYFLLFFSFYFLYRFIHKERTFYLIISALALNLSSMLRFESWIFVFLFTFILFLRHRFSRYVYIFFVLSCVFPIICMHLNYRASGDPLGFLTTHSLVAQAETRDINLFHRTSEMIRALVIPLSLPVFIGCVLGFILSLKKGLRSNPFILLFSAALTIFVLKTMKGSLNLGNLRYFGILGLLLLPFGGLAFKSILESSFLKKSVKLLFLISVVIVCMYSSAQALKFLHQHTKISDSLIEMASWLRLNVKLDEKVLLEYGCFHPFITVNAHLYPNQIIQYDQASCVKNKEITKYYIATSDYIGVCKIRGGFRFLLSELRNVSNGTLAFENNEWAVFRFKRE